MSIFAPDNSSERDKAVQEVRDFIQEQKKFLKDNYRWYQTTFWFMKKYLFFLKNSKLREYYKQPLKVRFFGMFILKFFILIIAAICIYLGSLVFESENYTFIIFLIIITIVFVIYLIFIYPYFYTWILSRWAYAIALVGYNKSLFDKKYLAKSKKNKN